MAVERNEFSLYAVKLVPAGNVVRFPQVDDHTAGSARGLPSYVVRDTPPQLPETARVHGITPPEIRHISDGFHRMRTVAHDNGWRGWRVYRVDCAPCADTAYFEQRLTTFQGQAGIAKLWLRVTETWPAVHFHYVVLVDAQVLARCAASTKFNDLTAGRGRVFHFQRIRNDAGWRYLTKEATPQARWGNPRIWHNPRKGPYRLPGDDIADRVTVSAELAKHVEPWKRRYRRHKPPGNAYPAERKRPCLTTTAPVLAGQIPLFDDPRMKRPVNRLDEFGGGLMPAVVAGEIEFRRHQLGWSQRELARRCGIGQPQLENVLRGHDRLSAWATRRMRDILLAEAA